MQDPVYLFSHGFGFTPHYWQPLLKYLQPNKWFCVDWELWSDFKKLQSHLKKVFGEKAIFLGVGHSLGFAKLLRFDPLLQGIVGLNAFTDFLGFEPHLRRRRLYELKAFITHFRRSPYQTLQAFYKRCGAYDEDMRVTSKIFLLSTPDTEFAQDYLGGDLLRLRQRVQALKMTKTLIVNSCNDTIVPPVLTNDNFGSECLDNLFLMEEGRHMVGFFAAKEIALRIERFVTCL